MSGEELRFIKDAFASNYIAPLGPMVDAFDREFAEKVGIPNAVAVASGTAAMPWWNSFTSVKLASPRLNSLGFNRVNIPQGKHFVPVENPKGTRFNGTGGEKICEFRDWGIVER